jgi:transcription elongation factor GreA
VADDVPGPDAGGAPRAAQLGSTVVLEGDGETLTITLVGSAEADLAAGRISIVSPIGRAALGRRPGDDVLVRTPGGEVTYRLVELR